jgi:hypothetical protein
MQSSDVAFTIVVNRQADDNAGQAEDEFEEGYKDNNRVELDFAQEAVQDAIQEAVQDAVQEVCSELLLPHLMIFCMLPHAAGIPKSGLDLIMNA